METVLFVAAWLFVVTNLDKLVVLVAFCVDEDYRTAEVVLGHYVGFSVGLLGAVLGAILAAEFFRSWTFLLGVVPLGLGVWGLVRYALVVDTDVDTAPDVDTVPDVDTASNVDPAENVDPTENVDLAANVDTDGGELQVVPGPVGRIGVVTATAIGLNGENLAVYIPFFVGLSTAELALVVASYLVGAGIVIAVALLIARRTLAAGVPGWVDRWLVPIVLVVVGGYVLLTGVLVV